MRMLGSAPYGFVVFVLLASCSTSASDPPSLGEPPEASASEVGGSATSASDAGGASPTVHSTPPTHLIRGTNGDDVLVGTPDDDVMDGLRGTDAIRGGAGDDELSDYSGVGTGRRLDTTADTFRGGPGDDRIYSSHRDHVLAGPGNDMIWADYLQRGDTIACGAGRDVVILNDDDPGIVATGCETVRVEYAG